MFEIKNTMLAAMFLLGMLLVVAPYAFGQERLRDPTAPPNAETALSPSGEAASTGGLTVSAIFISGSHRVAVINGNTVKVGDDVGGYKVQDITRDFVELADVDGSKVLLRINNITIKHPAMTGK